MDSSSEPNWGSSIPKPPKLRAACNECHAAKVRCTGEKNGCQRCENQGLRCIFAISKLGKVPGKRARINKISNAGENNTRSSFSAESRTDGSSSAVPATTLPLSNHDPSTVAASHPVKTATLPGIFNAVDTPIDLSQSSLLDDLPLLEDIHPSRHPSMGDSSLLDMNFPNDDSWLLEPDLSYLDQAPSPPPPPPPLPALFSDSSKSGFDLLGCDMSPFDEPTDHSSSSNSNLSTRDSPGLFSVASTLEPDQFESSLPPNEHHPIGGRGPLFQLLLLISSIERCLSRGARSPHPLTVDAVLAANQRFIIDLQRLLRAPDVARSYPLLMLASVALGKAVNLFVLGSRDFVARAHSRGPAPHPTPKPLVSFGVFALSAAEQRNIGRQLFLCEVRRARHCLAALVMATDRIGSGGLQGTGGRHEGFHVAMGKKLDRIAATMAEPGEGARGYC